MKKKEIDALSADDGALLADFTKIARGKITTDAALAVMKDFWLSDGLLTPEKEDRFRLASRKLLADSAKFYRRANEGQQQQFKKLRRFYQQATFGPALSKSLRRQRAALFLNDWRLFSRTKIKNGQIRILDGLDYLRVLRPILEALHTNDGEFFNDLAVAIRFGKTQPRVNAFLAEYSLLMAGKQPVLTFGELNKILRWTKPADLRKAIRRLRKRYGSMAVPLRLGRPGRPPKK
jgi:hypothetical protein